MTLIDTLFPKFYTSTARSSVPYNIFTRGESEVVLEFNVCGFSESELDVEVENNTLSIVGAAKKFDDSDRRYIVRDINSQSFRRSFTLHEDTEVHSASVKNGVLTIILTTKIPEHKKPKKIPVTIDANG